MREGDSGVVLPDMRVVSVMTVGRDGEPFLVFRWKPDRKRSIVEVFL